jgi:selenide,water dikinase
MESPIPTPIQKNVVLVGAGNAHLQFVRMFAMRPIAGVAVTLVSEAPVMPYSAMVPGHIARDYTWNEITIDLVRLCRAANVRFITARALAIDAADQVVRFASRPEMRFDALSLGVGSSIALPPGLTWGDTSWPIRPMSGMIERLDHLEQTLCRTNGPFHLVIVGGGASGCELALAIRRRFEKFPQLRMTLLQSTERLLPGFTLKAADIFAGLLQAKQIAVRTNVRVLGGTARTLELRGSEAMEYDAVLWATHAAPPELLRTSGLPLADDGFLRVHATLQSVGNPAVFGTGDCIAIENHPDLLKNGVYAVREGGVLFENVARYLTDRPLETFQPQKVCLCLMNTADGQAVFNYGPLVWKGRLVRWLKDRIDRAWMEKFTRNVPMKQATAEDEPASMRCGGCGNKISSDVLSAVLKRIKVIDDPRVLLGCAAGEDAAVHRVRPELFGDDPEHLVEVQTVDYFKAFVDDPYLFGRIAALNAISDLYAMNARPFSALAIATLPYARGPVQEGMLYELLTGASQSLQQLGVVLTGGHTTEGSELALGFAVTGYAEEHRLFQKSKLQPGDVLILTKPLGSGALLAAWMRGECPAEWFKPMIDVMLNANDRASRIFADAGVQACTDVTGFGLAGHLLEMLDASKVSARLDGASVPLYAGFDETVKQGIVSTLHRDNAKVECRIQSRAPAPAWLFDPQTSGGLIAAVRPERVDETLRGLKESGCDRATVIGEILAGPPVIDLN